MKAYLFSLLILSTLIFNRLQAQNSESSFTTPSMTKQPDSAPLSINPSKWYLDAGGGYFPANNAASFAGQIGGGYRLSPASALGVGGAYWGRVSTYQRSAMGIGLQYRHILWDNFIAKIEGGYVLKAYISNEEVDRNMTYIAESSTPLYYKCDLHWRIRHFLTLGISAYQTTNLKFIRHLPHASTILDTWRINAFTVQLGIALDTRSDK
jgi:hypothetical protein